MLFEASHAANSVQPLSGETNPAPRRGLNLLVSCREQRFLFFLHVIPDIRTTRDHAELVHCDPVSPSQLHVT